MTRRSIGLAGILALAALLGSCSSRLGWGVVLWSAPDGPIPAGAVAPVFIKSNIQKVYVVGVPGAKGKDRNKKIELPLWQVELFQTRGKAAARVKAMGENVSLYMVAARDGIPLRDKPSNDPNKSKRVFRLREGQSVKILEKVEGDAVSTGGQALPGAWYEVLADDGTVGFAFSYAFRLYDEAKEGPPVLASAKPALSGRVDLVFSRSWRPEYFQEMIDDNRIDLDYFSLRYGLFVDAIRRQVRLELPAASEVFNYSGVSEAKGIYSFDGSPLRIKIESDSRMVLSWSGAPLPGEEVPAASGSDAAKADAVAAAAATAQDDESAPPPSVEGVGSTGAAGIAALVVLSVEARESIRLEALRRQKLLTAFVDEVGGAWSSAGAGRLTLAKNGRFAWKARGEAAASIAPAGAGEAGEVALRLFLDPALAPSWDGAVSFRFDQESPDGPRQKWVDFLYRRSPAGLVLAPAASSGLLASGQDSRAEPLVLEPAAE
jgi:hypothetical protein